MRMASATASRIVLIEDDPKIAENVAARLRQDGHAVVVAGTGELGLSEIRSVATDLVVLDLTLPGIGGLEVLRTLRAEDTRIRVIILTSHDSTDDRVTGLNEGADDYLGKPFALTELSARVRSVLRRGEGINPQASTFLAIADLRINLDERIVSRAGVSLELTNREFHLLVYLVEHRKPACLARDAGSRRLERGPRGFTPLDQRDRRADHPSTPQDRRSVSK